MKNEFKEKYKVDAEEKKEKDIVSIILEYIKKEQEINRYYDELEGIAPNENEEEDLLTINRISYMLAYRELRTKQAYTSKICRGNNSQEARERLATLDRDRREKHNLALTSFNGLIDFGIKNNLPPIYEGRRLTEKEIETHDPMKYDERREMTDAFLQILKDLGDYSTRTIEDEDGKKKIEKLQARIYKNQRDYGITQDLIEDDGDIGFKDFEKDEYR